MEVKNLQPAESADLLSASWRLRKAGGVIPAEGLRTREASGVGPSESQGLRTGATVSKAGRRQMFQLRESDFALPLPFGSVWLSTDWKLPVCLVKVDILCSVY